MEVPQVRSRPDARAKVSLDVRRALPWGSAPVYPPNFSVLLHNSEAYRSQPRYAILSAAIRRLRRVAPRGYSPTEPSSSQNSFVALRGVLSMNLMATEEELKAEIARLRAENQALQRPARGQMSLKVSEKGALSVYGLGRFPVTLYREQWEKLLGMADEIRAFIQQNDGALKKKE
jgi:hypothetical protein